MSNKLFPRGKYIETRNIQKLFILGGTHGNERTGVHAIQYIKKYPKEFISGTVQSIETIHANPNATKKNVRFIEEDLNRCHVYDYQNPLSGGEYQKKLSGESVYEKRRALEIRKELNALNSPADFVIDLHTTTANMGNCLIISDDDPWTQHLCKDLTEKIDDCKVLYENVARENEKTSSSLGKNHITLEIGPVQQGVGHFPIVLEMLKVIKQIVGSIDSLNGKTITEGVENSNWFSCMSYVVDYPRNELGVPVAVIHEDFLYQDYKPISLGDPIFRTYDGEEIHLELSTHFPDELIKEIKQGKKICPVFIGESAYVEKKQAFILTEKT